jgi:hypothetical protein
MDARHGGGTPNRRTRDAEGRIRCCHEIAETGALEQILTDPTRKFFPDAAAI